MVICEKIYEEWLGKVQEEKIIKIIEEVKPSGKILDVGCGTGVLERFVNAVAVDINLEYLKGVKSDIKIIASGDALPFKSEAFDFVFCIDVVHLLKNLQDLVRVLRKHGKLVVSIFCNEQNLEERKEWLRKRISEFEEMKIEKSFVVKTEIEWDFVIIAKRI